METNKSKEEKWQMFFDMQEHPENYTDEQIDRLLADEDIKEFFRNMAMARMAQQKANPKQVDVDEAWKKFSFKLWKQPLKIAASVIGVIFLSGVAFAAIHSGVFRSSPSDAASFVKAVPASAAVGVAKHDSVKAKAAEKQDSINLRPAVFDNAELQDVVSQIAAFYRVKVEFESEEAKHIRIFFNWNKAKTLQQNLAVLNAFDRIQITDEDGVLKVE